MVVKPFVGADYNRSYARRELGEASFEEVKNPGGGMGIAGPQFPVPEVTTMTLEAEQRMVRRPPSLDGVVADPCLFLFAVDHEHGGVHIEDHPRG